MCIYICIYTYILYQKTIVIHYHVILMLVIYPYIYPILMLVMHLHIKSIAHLRATEALLGQGSAGGSSEAAPASMCVGFHHQQVIHGSSWRLFMTIGIELKDFSLEVGEQNSKNGWV